MTANAISPSAETRMIERIPADMLEVLVRIIPRQRIAHPDGISAPVAFLASDEACYVTGTVVPVDGGFSM